MRISYKGWEALAEKIADNVSILAEKNLRDSSSEPWSRPSTRARTEAEDKLLPHPILATKKVMQRPLKALGDVRPLWWARVSMSIKSVVLVVMALGGATAVAVPDFPAYSVTDLKALGIWPAAMNQKGQVVGHACCGRQSTGALIYASGDVRDLGLPAGAFWGFRAIDINDNGWVVGLADADANANPSAIWATPALHDGVGWTVIDTSSFGTTQGYPREINNAGQVIGTTQALGVGEAWWLGGAWLFDHGTLIRLTPLSSSVPTDINETGQVVGTDRRVVSYPDEADPSAYWSWRDGQLTTFRGQIPELVNDAGTIVTRGFDWASYVSGAYVVEGGVTTPIPIIGCDFIDRCGMSPTAMNERGDVAGSVILRPASPNEVQSAFLYRMGETTALGTLGGLQAAAQSLNNRGQVAGWSTDSQARLRPFVYDDGVMLDVSELRGVGAAIDLGNPISIAVAINDGPYVLVTGFRYVADNFFLESAYLLTPVAPTVTVTAVPNSVAVRTSITLTWSSQNANSCLATGGVAGDGWAGTQPASGQVTVTSGVPGAVQYAIRCSAGPLASDSAALVTYAAAPPTVRLTATPSSSRVRAAITLAWMTEGADNCMATGGRPGDGWVGILATSGNRQVTEMSPGVVEYGVICSAGELSSEAKVSATFEKKSGGGGHVDVIAVLVLAGLGLRRRRKH